jgi:hypothetical protein
MGRPPSSRLLDFTFQRTYPEAADNFRAALRNGRLVVKDSTGEQELTPTPDVRLPYEWAWRTQELKSQIVVSSIRAPLATFP